MGLNCKNLLIRTISGAVLVALIVCVVIFALDSIAGAVIFGVFFSFIMIVCLKEFLSITIGENSAINLFLALFPSLLLLWSPVVERLCDINIIEHHHFVDLFIALYFVLLVIYFVASFFIKNEMVNFKFIVTSMIYIAVPFALFGTLELEREGNMIIALGMFFVIWGNDTFAYLVGSLLGKHKMFPMISPKKSWEGFVGGLLGSLAVGTMIYYVNEGSSLVNCLVFSVMISLFATFGDLFESIIKRKFGVKDSGTIIPGHGGMLDRFDSFLFAAPAAFVFYWMFWPNVGL
ncbi:MAG: phosphatidate cytidylyltransferase [Candidatus Aphodosoma sp.]